MKAYLLIEFEGEDLKELQYQMQTVRRELVETHKFFQFPKAHIPLYPMSRVVSHHYYQMVQNIFTQMMDAAKKHAAAYERSTK